VDFEVVFPKLPDLTQISWDQVLSVREHPSAVEFRQQIRSVSQEARKAHLAGESADAIRYHVMKWRDDQLIEELSNRLMTNSEAVREVVVSLSFVIGSAFPLIGPFIGAIDACRSVIEPLVERTRDRESMAAAFVRRQQNGSA
jgi:hypothetical protein